MTLNRRMTVTVAVACILTSTVLYPLFKGSEWFYAGAGAVIAVAASGALSRLRVLPVPVCLAISVLGLLLYLNLVFEAHHSLLWVIPTLGSVTRLWHLLVTGFNDSRGYAPPAADLPGLVLIAAGGIGLMAVLTDLIAVRLRSTALAGLPLLVLYTVPITMRAPSGAGAVIVFCLGMAGYLAMLSADGRERIRLWGRLVSLWRSGSLYDGPGRRRTADADGYAGSAANGAGTGRRVAEPDPGPDTRALAASGRRIGLASIVLALCVPLILPGLHASKLLSSGPGIGGDGDGSGGGTQASPGALTLTLDQLNESHPTTVLTYTTTASQALQENDPPYLEQYVYDSLGPKGWQVTEASAGAAPATVTSMPSPPGLSGPGSIQPFTTDVNVASGALLSRSAQTFLPMPYPAAQVTTPPGSWLTDNELMVYSRDDDVPVKTYQVSTYDVDPTGPDLNNAAALPGNLSADLALPPSYQTAALKQIADTETQGATTEYQKVDDLAVWLSGKAFHYSSSGADFSTPDGLLKFLTKTRTGVCVQSAYAMTVLTRLLGIPARLVQGYTEGTPTSRDKYVVKSSDAHAWTEVYFSGWGWVRFEPTPGGPGTAIRPNYMTGGGSSGTGGPNPAPTATGPAGVTPTGSASSRGNTKPLGDQGSQESPAAAQSGGTPWAAIVLAVVAAIALACGVIAMVAPPAQRLLSAHPAEAVRRRSPVSPATAVVVLIVAAIVALSLYRLLSHTSGLDLRAGWATIGIAFGAAGAVVLVGPAILRVVLRRWRWMRARDDVSRAHTAWREFGYDLEDLGIGHRPSEPPRTLASRVSSELREPAADAVRRLALAEERASYAARPADSATLRRDGALARRGVAAAARRGSRWRARIFPVSVLTNVADGAARIPDRLAALVPHRSAERGSAS